MANANDTANDDKGPSRALALRSTEDTTKTILVNGREHPYAGDQIGRTELVRLAFPDLSGTNGAVTVAYDHGPLDAPTGLLGGDRTTRVLQGQTFSVSCTDKS
jgi:hypothetical protein